MGGLLEEATHDHPQNMNGRYALQAYFNRLLSRQPRFGGSADIKGGELGSGAVPPAGSLSRGRAPGHGIWETERS